MSIRQLLTKCRKYVLQANYTAEARHDDIDGDYYMDSVQYEIMKETENLLGQIDDLIKETNNDNRKDT